VPRAERFTVVEMSGSHHEMGRQYGRQCKEGIRRLVDAFDELILRGERVEAARAVARQAVPWVREAAPELVEEVEGIAAGAGLDFDDVFRLNCSVELFAWRGCVGGDKVSTVPRACSSFALRAAEGTLVAWNMDWWRLWLPHLVLLHGVPNDGPRFLAFAFAGCVGRPGMSEHVAMAANYLPYRGVAAADGAGQQWAGPGVPYNFLSRMLLQQRSTADAVALIATTRRMASLNYTLGDDQGDICCVETTPVEHHALRPGGEDFIVHANSYHSPAFGGMPEAEQRERDPRAHHAREQLRAHGGDLDRPTLQAVQTSHFPGQATGVCVHRKLQDRDGITLLSFVAQPGRDTMWAAVGPPCEHDFLAYEL